MPELEPKETKQDFESWEVPAVLRKISPYFLRLMIDRYFIRDKIENPGGSVIVGAAQKVELEATNQYSPVLGNDFHLDLLDATEVLMHMNADERRKLLQWCDALPPQTAAEFTSVRPAFSVRRRATETKVQDDRQQPDSTGEGGATQVRRLG